MDHGIMEPSSCPSGFEGPLEVGGVGSRALGWFWCLSTWGILGLLDDFDKRMMVGEIT